MSLTRNCYRCGTPSKGYHCPGCVQIANARRRELYWACPEQRDRHKKASLNRYHRNK